MGGREGLHAVLDLAHVGVEAHEREADPAGHLRNAQRDGAGGGDVARRGRAVGPEPERGADHEDGEDARDDHEKQAERRGDRAEVEGAVAVGLHRGKGRLIFVFRGGKEFDRAHVRHGIDDLTRHHGAGGGAGLGLDADAGEEAGDEGEVEAKPDQQDGGDAPVDGEDEQQRGDEGGQREDDGVQDLDRHLCQGAGGLHLFLGDATGKVVVEEGDGLTHRPAVQAGEDQDEEVWVDRHALIGGGEAIGGGAEEDEEDGGEGEEAGVVGPERGGAGRLGGVDDDAEEHGGKDLGAAGEGGDDAGGEEDGAGARERPAEEGKQAAGRLGGRVVIDGGDEAAEPVHQA